MDMHQRTKTRGLSDPRLLNGDVIVAGFVKRVRKLGNLCFALLRDDDGDVQVVAQSGSPTFACLHGLPRESVVAVRGKLQKRVSPNPNVPLGDLEVAASEVNVISRAETPPLIAEDETDALEDVRLQYRYLDLRRPAMKKNLRLRFAFTQAVRNHLQKRGFTEIETPCFTKPTPEGARDYVVPTRHGPNRFYALPQSPQIYKQLLMIAGFERYFQIARCFRDEDGRKDRQPEHTQIDLELAYADQETVQTEIEGMFAAAFGDALGIELKPPFPRMKYADAMARFGCDKPDLRFGCELRDVTEKAAETGFAPFARAAQSADGAVLVCELPGAPLENRELKALEKAARDNGAAGLAHLAFAAGKPVSGSLAKLPRAQALADLAADKTGEGTLLFAAAQERETAQRALGAVRTKAAELRNLADPKRFEFVWVVDWPLYEYDAKAGRYESAHNLFTSPAPGTNVEALVDSDEAKKNARAASYDLVLNGFELGSGAIRVHDPKVQGAIMRSLGLSEAQIREKFGFLLDAYRYGAPVHGGMGLGLDRIMMIVSGAESIRDVIAFPKNAHGTDPMMDAPAPLDGEFLAEAFVAPLPEKK